MSTIGGAASGWRAGGDKASQPFAISEEQWQRIFSDPQPEGGGAENIASVIGASRRALVEP